MRVIATLIDMGKETKLEGDAPVFGNGIDYTKGIDSRLRDIGFWLENWKYAGHGGPNHKSRVFIPWSSALYIEGLKEE